MTRILVTNDDGWDAPGLAALKQLASSWGEVCIVAPRDPQSYAGHRVTTETDLHLTETAPNEFHLSGTPADCVRVALMELFPDIDLVLSGINRGGNLGSDLYISGTVAAAREAALLGRRSLAISQFMRKDVELDWSWSQQLARPVLDQIFQEAHVPKSYWNVNLPAVPSGTSATSVHCHPDNEPLDIRYTRAAGVLRYSGLYRNRPRTPGRDIDHCFSGNITISQLHL